MCGRVRGSVISKAQQDAWWSRSVQKVSDYDKAIEHLKPIVFNYSPLIIAIDGLNGVGKTNLSRYLAMYFKLPLVEIDQYRISGCDEIMYDEILRLIRLQVDRRRHPIIIDGVAILWVLRRISRVPDCRIFVKNTHSSDASYDRDDELGEYLAKYLQIEKPEETANLIVDTKIDLFSNLYAE
jgi:adenylate kinase family enzyme